MSLVPRNGRAPVSVALRLWIAGAADGVSIEPPPMAQGIAAEARALAAGLEASRDKEPPITAEALVEWLRPIALAVRNPPSDDAIEARAEALSFAVFGRYPAYVFDAELQRKVMLNCDFWPSVKDIADLLFVHEMFAGLLPSSLRRAADKAEGGAP